ncbi:MAG: hypothetical protein KDA42_01735 [Planctomycetales bacterium]|nr:hypothetical protein [Planctomycetales bacterium]
MDKSQLEDLRWLVSAAAAPLLAEYADCKDSFYVANQLRKHVPAERSRLVAEQVELRRRASAKFSQAGEMFFARVQLEQATEQSIAEYKASRFFDVGSRLDLCSGIGGDLIALAAQRPTIGVDNNPAVALLAEANLRVAGSSAQSATQVVCATARPQQVADVDGWHIDPDRRARGRRSTRLEDHQPDASWLREAITYNQHGAIKLAPAASVPADWEDAAELEWISTRGECRQLVVWFGQFALQAGQRSATAISSAGVASIVGRTDTPVHHEARLAPYLFEPDSAVLAAKLDGALAHELGAWRFDPRCAYLTGEQPATHPLATCFQVEEVLPLSIKPLKAALASRDIGRLEIKKRGVDMDPDSLRRKLGLRGSSPGILVAAPLNGRQVALLVRRREGA